MTINHTFVLDSEIPTRGQDSRSVNNYLCLQSTSIDIGLFNYISTCQNAIILVTVIVVIELKYVNIKYGITRDFLKLPNHSCDRDFCSELALLLYRGIMDLRNKTKYNVLK